MNQFRPRTKQRGSSMALTMMFFTVIGMVTIAALGVTTTNDAMVQRAVEKTQATALAESGIEMLYDQICRDHAALQTPGQTRAQSNIRSTFSGHDRVQGSYTARVIKVTTTQVSPAPSQPAGSVLYTHVYEVEATGTAKNGTTSIARAKFTIRRALSGPDSAGGGASFINFPGVINSNTSVEFVTDTTIKTQDPAGTDKSAHVVANKGVIWQTASGAKQLMTNPDIIDVQGFILVANQPSSQPLDLSRGVSGLGNPNGMKNYRTAIAHSTPSPDYTVVENEITGMGQERHFPDLAELVAMRNALSTTASSAPGTKAFGTVNSSTVVADNATKTKFLDAPAVLTGDLLVSAGTRLSLRPTATDPNDNVIFVYGDVSNLGTLSNLGVKLVVLGTYSDSPTASYNLMTGNGPYATLEEVYQKSALISFSQRKDAIKIASNVNARYGNVYAAAGGINVTGSLEMNGILTSGGPEQYSPNTLWDLGLGNEYTNLSDYGGGVKIAPNNGAQFTVNFVREAKSLSISGVAGNAPYTLLAPIQADRLTDWRKLR